MAENPRNGFSQRNLRIGDSSLQFQILSSEESKKSHPDNWVWHPVVSFIRWQMTEVAIEVDTDAKFPFVSNNVDTSDELVVDTVDTMDKLVASDVGTGNELR